MKRHFFLIFISFLSLFLREIYAQTLTLDSCIALARQNNADIRTSRLDLQRAQAVKKQVFTKYFPQVSLGAIAYKAAQPVVSFGTEDVQSNDVRELLEAIYEAFSEETDINNKMELMKHGTSASVTLAQPIFVGGRIVNGNKLAAIGEEAAQLKAEIKERDIIENIESTFYLVSGLAEKVATIQAAMNLIDSLDRVVSSALDNGLVTQADALQLELKRNEMKALNHKLISGIRLSRRLLCTQIGIDYSDDILFVDNGKLEPPRLEFAYSDRCDSLRPESRLLNLNVEAEKLFKKMTIGETLPQLAFIGIGYYGDMVREYATGNLVAALSLKIPVTAWWETSHKIQEHNVKIEQATIMQDNYTKMMSLEEEKTYSDMMDAWMLMKSDSAALEVARENYRLAQLNYSAGNMTISDVLQAHALLLQAGNAITDRRVEYVAARRRLSDIRGNFGASSE